MPTFIYQSEFRAARVPDIPVAPGFFEFVEINLTQNKKKKFIVGEFSYPLQPPTIVAAPDGLENLDGFVFKTSKSKKSRLVETFFYPLNISVIPPVPLHTGYYEEIFDFGLTISNVIVNLSWNVINIVGEIAIQSQIRTSTDNFNWTAFQDGPSVFASQMRFADVKFTFTADDYKSAIEMANLVCQLAVKYETDQGSKQALAADGSGTRITFAKAFKQVTAVAITPSANQVAFAAYNNLDATGCNVFVYDNSGNRINCLVTWIARGIL